MSSSLRNARCRSASSSAPTSGSSAAAAAGSSSSAGPETSSQKPSTSLTGSSHTVPPGVDVSPAVRGTAGAMPGIGPGGQAEDAPVVAPQAHASVDECPEAVDHEIEPSYGRRSVMQMEFPCSLKLTSSTSFRMR